MKFISILLVLVLMTFSGCKSKTAQQSLDDFYLYNGEAIDPLILAGNDVVPLVISSVKDKTMKKRSFALVFLGNGGYDEALPVLKEVLEDPADPDRDAALLAIYQIDPGVAMSYASVYSRHQDRLGRIATDILQNKEYLTHRRTYFDALFNYADNKYAENP